MKKIYLFVCILCLQFFTTLGQSISPVTSILICPKTEYTFTFSIPYTGYHPLYVSSVSAEYVTQQPFGLQEIGGSTNGSFKGTFRDENVNQAFKLYGYDIYNDYHEYIFTYSHIVSLSHPEEASIIVPPGAITALPCQIQNFGVTFTKVKYTNYSTVIPNKLIFSEVNDYEYLLPTGWSIGSSVSTGSNWIGGSNSVTVTSDLSNGVKIQVRPANNCAANLASGGISEIAINRPRPPLTFTGGSTVCTSTNFQAYGAPAAFTGYTWSTSPPGMFTSSNLTSNPTTITKVANGEGDIALNLSSPGCSLNFSYNTLEITGQAKLVAGVPVLSATFPLMLYSGPGDENEICRNQETILDMVYNTGTTNTWTLMSWVGGPQPSWNPSVYPDDFYIYFFKPNQQTALFQLQTSNSCGTSTYDIAFKAVDCGLRAAPKKFKISPNPSRNMVSISQQDASAINKITDVYEVDLLDHNQLTIQRRKYQNSSSIVLDVSGLKFGIYFVRIIGKTGVETHKLIKE